MIEETVAVIFSVTHDNSEFKIFLWDFRHSYKCWISTAFCCCCFGESELTWNFEETFQEFGDHKTKIK